MTKEALRAQISVKVKNLSPIYCEEADQAICEHIRRWRIYQEAQTIFCYAGTAREINTYPLLKAILADGKRLALPLCTGPGVMEAREITGIGDLVSGKYNILAPRLTCPLLEPEAIDLALVPCCTGNAHGQRLGYGGGFYDRYLPKLRCPTALLCRGQLVEENIPMSSHDVLLQYLITENGIIACT